MTQQTPLYDLHLAAGARMVDFAGWRMPLHYGSQIEEHHAVRREAGLFDISHMAVSDLHGPDAQAALRLLLANDVARLDAPGRALYTCMLNEQGGVVDDLIVYRLDAGRFRLITNAATHAKDRDWIGGRLGDFDARFAERADFALLALQGPRAPTLLLGALAEETRRSVAALARFSALKAEGLFIARTGYTGEEGFEIALPKERAAPLWEALTAAGARPCGLGARDTLRLEAGMMLYGADMTDETTPLESGLGWSVAWGAEGDERREFIGRAALERQRAAGAWRKMVGLLLEGRGVMRAHQPVFAEGVEETGEIASGGFSPTLNRSIALARIPAAAVGARCAVDMRGERAPVRVVKPVFVRAGQPVHGDL